MNVTINCMEILMAVHNGELYLREQLDSLLAQDCDCWHLTASDDASTDRSPAILAQYAAAHPRQITLVTRQTGFGNARDHFLWLMAQCQAPYMMFCDQDDRWHADKVRLTLSALVKAEDECGAQTPLLVFTDAMPAKADLTPICASLMAYQQQDADSIRDFRRVLLQNVVTGCTCAINGALRQRALVKTPTDAILMHDWWLAAVAARFGRGVYLPQTTMDYRLHGDNQVGAKDFRSLRCTLEQLLGLKAQRRQILRKKAQAAAFRQAYQSELSQDELTFLDRFARSRSGAAFYWRNRALFCGRKRFWGMLLLG